MLPEEKARVKIDKQLRNAGWDIVARDEFVPNSTSAIKELLIHRGGLGMKIIEILFTEKGMKVVNTLLFLFCIYRSGSRYDLS